MILVEDTDGTLVAREDWEGSDLNCCIEELQLLPARSVGETEMVGVSYAEEVA